MAPRGGARTDPVLRRRLVLRRGRRRGRGRARLRRLHRDVVPAAVPRGRRAAPPPRRARPPRAAVRPPAPRAPEHALDRNARPRAPAPPRRAARPRLLPRRRPPRPPPRARAPRRAPRPRAAADADRPRRRSARLPAREDDDVPEEPRMKAEEAARHEVQPG